MEVGLETGVNGQIVMRLAGVESNVATSIVIIPNLIIPERNAQEELPNGCAKKVKGSNTK